MPGTYIFRPIEANLSHETGLIGRMNPYCAFVVGDDRINSEVCKKGGKHPEWKDFVTIPMSKKPAEMLVEVMDKEMLTKDDVIGTFVLDLHEIQSKKKINKWYPISYNNKPAGEILIEATFTPNKLSKHSALTKEEKTKETEFTEMEGEFTSLDAPNAEEKVIFDQKPDNQVFIEQEQAVEPHTFLKEVDATEIRPHTQQIEVMEPVQVTKEVQYTKAMPVTKQIEVIEPQVVMKEVEVIEPRLVTKEIQVVENVPVKKQIEVIESKTIMKEVETFEPQTFTKQIEVTEHVPVTKQVEVSEPVHIMKTVEFVEPVITTKTITKEMVQPMVVDEKVTTEMGPATLVATDTDAYSEKNLTEEERILNKEIPEEERMMNKVTINKAMMNQEMTEEEEAMDKKNL